MAVEPAESLEIKETDIIFDCPFCGKSLAIDYRGAGLSIPCSDCGKYAQVPIPEGMELTDIDSTEEEQEIRILNLRKSLSSAHDRVRELETEIQELHTRRGSLERSRTTTMSRLATIRSRIGLIRDSMDRIDKALSDIAKAAEEEA